jgi:hypothetical protein
MKTNSERSALKLERVRPALVILAALALVVIGASGLFMPEHLARLAGLFMPEVVKAAR